MFVTFWGSFVLAGSCLYCYATQAYRFTLETERYPYLMDLNMERDSEWKEQLQSDILSYN